MAFFGLRKWPTPIAGPMWPFFVASAITFYGVAKAQDAMIKSPEHANSPKNPYAAKVAAEAAHH
ncbi:ATPase, F0 complex, subunit J [Clavulina sp. PMI_390]|nr:ATPase, F0 complex, subunit J [Clavulina sp. PMI_390]